MLLRVTIVALLVGGTLGYAWHEAAPRVLGSAPFCGPKYPGMLRAIPEDEYFPRQLITDYPASIYERPRSAMAPDINQPYSGWIEDVFPLVAEPSLWRMAQQGENAIRFTYTNAFYSYLVVTVTFDESGGRIRSKYFHVTRDFDVVVSESADFEISTEQVQRVRDMFDHPDLALDEYQLWGQCFRNLRRPQSYISSNWGPGFELTADGSTWTIEISEPGRYLIFTEDIPRQRTWMWHLGNSLALISGLPEQADLFQRYVEE